MKNKWLLLALLLAGCNPLDKGKHEPVVMTIAEIHEDKSPMGCIGTYWITVLRHEDGRAERLCGRWGKPGEKVAGCWVTGAADSTRNGFRRICE